MNNFLPPWYDPAIIIAVRAQYPELSDMQISAMLLDQISDHSAIDETIVLPQEKTDE